MTMDENPTQELRQVSEEMMNIGPFRKGRLRRRLMLGHIIVFFAAVAFTMIALGIGLGLKTRHETAKQLTAYAEIVAENIRSEGHRALAEKIKEIRTSEGKSEAEKQKEIEELKKSPAYQVIREKFQTVKNSAERIAHIHTIVKVDKGLAAIVASDDPDEVGLIFHYAAPELEEMRNGFNAPTAGPEKIGDKRISRIAGYAPIDEGETLVAVSRHDELLWDTIKEIGWIWLLPLAAGLALSAFMAWREAHVIIGPLHRTAKIIQQFSLGDMSERLSPNDAKVTRVLRRSVVDLGTSLDRRKRISAYYGRTLTPEMMDKIMEAGEEKLTQIGRRAVSLLRVDILSDFSPDDKKEAGKFFEVANAAARTAILAILGNDGSVEDLDSRMILGVFGSPLPMENHLQAALTAAEDIRRDLANVTARRKREGLPPFDLRLWMHTGEAALGLIGVPDRGEYRTVGEPVDTILSLKVPGEGKGAKIIITEAVAKAAGPRLKTNTLGCFRAPKGEIELLQLM